MEQVGLDKMKELNANMDDLRYRLNAQNYTKEHHLLILANNNFLDLESIGLQLIRFHIFINILFHQERA
jgi:hypothetical protein